MIGLGIGLVLLGYSLFYTGVENLTHAGSGHTLFQNMGFTSTINIGDPMPVTPNQSGQPPQPNQSPFLGGLIGGLGPI
jgi:hypothetical protein